MPAELDDTTSAGGDDTYMGDTYDDTITTDLRPKKKDNPILKKLFATCEDDALGSVHRAWAVTVLFMIVFFIVAIIEGEFIWCVVIALCIAMYHIKAMRSFSDPSCLLYESIIIPLAPLIYYFFF